MPYKLHTVLFDFHGVLCTDFFYNTLEQEHPEIYKRITTEFFKKNIKDIYAWMRNECSSEDINKKIATYVSLEYKIIRWHFYKSLTTMRINQSLLHLSSALRDLGIKTAIFTDNMDCFLETIVPHNHLEAYFDSIFSSTMVGMLKTERDLAFATQVIHALEGTFETTLLIDDGKNLGEAFQQKGGQFFHFQNNYATLASWLSTTFSLPALAKVS